MSGLHKRFDVGRGRRVRSVIAVNDLHLHARDGAITGLLGPNGAGKTTALRMLVGLVTPDAGTLEVDGLSTAAEPQGTRARLGVLSDARGLYPRLTARENIVYHGRLHGLDDDVLEARCETLGRLLDMRSLLDRRTDGFSQGERMKTALARALVHDPPNIVLDEPTNGLDVVATRALRDILRTLRDEGRKCIVFSTHIMQEVERLCDQVIVMARGRNVAEGTVAELCELAGTADFENAFVRLAFDEEGAQDAAQESIA
ncbi:MAG TPA: ATP-binding cassette domain-containing protein [Burkholderiaceae bacterium]|jgi:sodium transport system ATP-binding protein|nr:ATP-binding cassette domain-containing protein [Burkholderiaceae bacterium]